jgi:hypothetical protein
LRIILAARLLSTPMQVKEIEQSLCLVCPNSIRFGVSIIHHMS